MRRCPSSTRCWAAAWPPRKLVDPTLTMSREGTFIGSITTSGSRIAGERGDLVVPELVGHGDHGSAAVDGEVARPRGGLEARRRSLVDRLHADRHRHTELGGRGSDALDDLGGVAADLAAEGQLDGRVPLDRLQPAAVVVGAEHLLHAGAGRRRDVAPTVEHLRDRGDRDPRGRGHRGQRGAGFRRRHLGPPRCRVPSVSARCSTRTGVSSRRSWPTMRVAPVSWTVTRARSSAAEVPTMSCTSPASTIRSRPGSV